MHFKVKSLIGGLVLFFCFVVEQALRSGGHRVARSIGGHTSKIETYPYIVSLRYNKSYYCAGSILNDTIILTAASCNRPITNKIKVRVGSSFFRKKGKTIRAKEFIEHPHFDAETREKDIGIIVLQNPMVLKKTVEPVKLPASKQALPCPGQFVTITSWGNTDPQDNSSFSEEMKSIYLPIISKERCQTYHSDVIITDYMFCAGYFLGGKCTSYGDNGAPVVHKGVQYGVVSTPNDLDAYPMNPAIFTSVIKLRGFIESWTKI